MATKNAATVREEMSAADLFANADVIEGFDLRDKAEIVGVPFVITAVRFETNARNVHLAYMTAVTREGETFEFSDSSSTGVKAQITSYLLSRDENANTNGNTGQIFDMKLLAPRGLRVSTYEVEVQGRKRAAKTYYLSAGNR